MDSFLNKKEEKVDGSAEELPLVVERSGYDKEDSHENAMVEEEEDDLSESDEEEGEFSE